MRTAEALEDHLLEAFEDQSLPPAVVGLVVGDTSRSFAFGDREVGGIYEIGSVTKPFIGVLLAEMTLRGEVSFATCIGELLPETVDLGGDVAAITLEHLATHTSGLPRLPANLSVMTDPSDPYAGYTVDHLYSALASMHLEFGPGSGVLYSNLGYGLLGHVLERASGVSLGDLMKKRLLDPIGMAETTFEPEPFWASRLVQGHHSGHAVGHWHFDAMRGAGGLSSSIEDMIAFLKANLDPPASRLGDAIRMSHEPRVTRYSGWDMCLGWSRILRPGMDGRFHNGGTAGFGSAFLFVTEKSLGVVALSNSNHTDAMDAVLLQTVATA